MPDDLDAELRLLLLIGYSVPRLAWRSWRLDERRRILRWARWVAEGSPRRKRLAPSRPHTTPDLEAFSLLYRRPVRRFDEQARREAARCQALEEALTRMSQGETRGQNEEEPAAV